MSKGTGRPPGRGAVVAAAAVTLVLAAVFLAACGTSTGPTPAPTQSAAAHASPSAAATQAAASSTESVLVARKDGSHDALWLVPSTGGAGKAAGTLPGPASVAAASPDGQNVAYLSAGDKPAVWIGFGPLSPKTISLSGTGLKYASVLTWVSDKQILISGAAGGSYPGNQRLYLVDATSGAVSPFRGLRGAEPSAAPALGQVAYIQFTVLSQKGQTRHVRESIKLLRLGRPGAGRTVASQEYDLWYADYRAFAQPALSPDGRWVLSGVTGSDVRVTYTLTDTEMGVDWLSVFCVSPQADGWAPDGKHFAFGGTRAGGGGTGPAGIWVYDTTNGTMIATPDGLLSSFVSALAWSGDGASLVAAIPDTADGHVVALPADLTSIVDLGAGHAAVWVK